MPRLASLPAVLTPRAENEQSFPQAFKIRSKIATVIGA